MLTLARARAEKGVSPGALMTHVQPAASAAAAFRVIIADGTDNQLPNRHIAESHAGYAQFQGVMIPTTPMGCLIVTFRTPSIVDGM